MGVLCLPVLASGCTYGGGELLYNLGIGKSGKVAAQFKLTDGRLMVFIDDVHERVDWPQARVYLFGELTQALLRNNAAKKIIPLETIDALRTSTPDFNKLSARQLGELVEADQVLWVETTEFFAEETFIDAGDAAYWTATVKVLNPLEKTARTQVRLWPTSPAGHLVRVRMTGAHVSEKKTTDKISKELAKLMGEKIAKLFYEHRLDDFERPDDGPQNETSSSK
jgi:hypothetical protein